MQASKIIVRMTDDPKFLMMLREVAINFVVACEVKLEISSDKSAIYTRRARAVYSQSRG